MFESTKHFKSFSVKQRCAKSNTLELNGDQFFKGNLHQVFILNVRCDPSGSEWGQQIMGKFKFLGELSL